MGLGGGGGAVVGPQLAVGALEVGLDGVYRDIERLGDATVRLEERFAEYAGTATAVGAWHSVMRPTASSGPNLYLSYSSVRGQRACLRRNAVLGLLISERISAST